MNVAETIKNKKSRNIRFFSLILLPVLFAAFAGILFEKRPEIRNSIILGAKNYVKDRQAGFIRQLISKYLAEPEVINIDIKHKYFQKLAYKRKIAIARGVLLSGPEDYVPGKIRYKDKTINMKIRLKGDWVDHLQGDKWSYRIKIRGENTLFGMKQFSIHHPGTRNYIYEWILHRAFQKEDLISLRYDFIKVILNGKKLGIYALEEHFEKRLIEHNKRREGPIIKFNEDILWADRARAFHLGIEPATTYYSSNVDVFKTTRTLSDPVLKKEFNIARNLLESFRKKTLPPEKVFDVFKMAKFYALADLMGADHLTSFHNLRFYYNPVTSVLEPISFDGGAGNEISYLMGNFYRYHENSFHDFGKKLFENFNFTELYHRELERISKASYVDDLLDSLGDNMDRALHSLYSEFRKYLFYRNILYKNQEYIQKAIYPVKGFHAYFVKFMDNEIVLKIGNIQELPIEILGLANNGLTIYSPDSKLIISGKSPKNSVDYQTVSLKLPENTKREESILKELSLSYRVIGTSRIKPEGILPWPYYNENFVEKDFIRQNPNFVEFDFLTIDASSKRAVFKNGDWTLSKDLIIPKGYRVFCAGGVRLNLINSAKILSYSPMELKGDEEHPITIFSSDSTGQGLVIMNARKKSLFKYVNFKNLSNPAKEGWELTGAVTYYESPVDISHCSFTDNRSEDSLNIIRSDFSINMTIFSNAYSDAFDGDFVRGKISNTSFINSGNDAIDVSGSIVEIENIFINRAGDKGISAGEDSKVTANKLKIINSEIAIASKDESNIKVEDVEIKKCKIGMTAYQKKSEFDASSIILSKLKAEKVDLPYLIEEKSSLTVDGIEIEASEVNVEQMLYGAQYGKSSK